MLLVDLKVFWVILEVSRLFGSFAGLVVFQDILSFERFSGYVGHFLGFKGISVILLVLWGI